MVKNTLYALRITLKANSMPDIQSLPDLEHFKHVFSRVHRVPKRLKNDFALSFPQFDEKTGNPGRQFDVICKSKETYDALRNDHILKRLSESGGGMVGMHLLPAMAEKIIVGYAKFIKDDSETKVTPSKIKRIVKNAATGKISEKTTKGESLTAKVLRFAKEGYDTKEIASMLKHLSEDEKFSFLYKSTSGNPVPFCIKKIEEDGNLEKFSKMKLSTFGLARKQTEGSVPVLFTEAIK